MLRTRVWYAALAVATIGLGLVVHWHGDILGPTARDALGDALWAMMILWWVSALVPTASVYRRGLAALAICVAVEVSQLYHAPAVDAVRATTIGHLVLGSDFDARDLLAYALGILAAVLLERAWRKRHQGR